MSKFAVITLTYNNTVEFKRTARSLQELRESGLSVRWIVIDGQSDERHQAVIEHYLHSGDLLVSKQPKGIYDAMNVGLEHLDNEDHAMFLNSGDSLHWNALPLLSSLDPEISYSFDGIIAAGTGFFRRIPLESDEVSMPLHGAFAFRVGDGIRHKFDIKRKVDADSHWMREVITNSAPPHYIPKPLNIFALDGVSAGQSYRALRQNISDKPKSKAPKLVLRYLGFKLLGWKLYDLIFWNKFPKIRDPGEIGKLREYAVH